MLDTKQAKPALTPRQSEIYEFLKEKILNRGYGPTVREIGSHFDIRSPNGVMCHLKALEKKGYIKRQAHMSRAIELFEGMPTATLPVAGTVAAGMPVGAYETIETEDFGDLFEQGNVTTVADEESEEAHVSPGDFVVRDASGKPIAVIRRYE